MKRVLGIGLCCGLLAVGAYGQRGGGGHGGGFSGGHAGVGGSSRVFIGGANRGFGGGFSRGFGGFNQGLGGLNRSFAFHRDFNRFGGWGWAGWPVWGWGGWDVPYWDYSAGYAYPSYDNGYTYSPGYQPNVTVVYPPEQSTQISYEQRATPVVRNYDQYGQEIGHSGGSPGASAGQASNSSPVYLVAFKDGVIRAAESYSVSGNTLHFVTLQHEDKQAALDTVDRALSQRLNRERNVAFQLP